MTAPRTEWAIRHLRELIVIGTYPPGAKLPPEETLATEFGIGRNAIREAVRALLTARVLDVRRGDATYVTSLRPALLLEGIASAVDLFADDSALELMELRRILEPRAAGLAATRMDARAVNRLEETLRRLEAGAPDVADVVHHDTDFDAQIAAGTANPALAAILDGISSRSWRTRVWRTILHNHGTEHAMLERRRILDALRERDPDLATAASLMRVRTTEGIVERIVTGTPQARRG
jgi:GntR family transcriptional repressor for pyruvate dehydrogenase complex